jgi:uncharacterized protein YbaP (TraB family)
MKFLQCIWLALLVAASPATAADAGHPLSMWRIDGANNSIYLLGSIHMLREKDHPIPAAIYDAYAAADILIMELDMDDIDLLAEQALINELGLINDGRTLRDLMGTEMFARAELLASALQIPLALLDKSEPWYAAVTVEMMMLMRAGFSPAHGIEMRLTEIAARDNKEIRGLETTRQQLELLDNLSPGAQRDMLMQTLTESGDLASLMDELIDAWRHGDIGFLEDNLLSDMQDQTELHQVIVVNRNIAWVRQIQDLLDDDDNYLIVVGALHLVGEEGVPNLLAEQGLKIRQLRQP